MNPTFSLDKTRNTVKWLFRHKLKTIEELLNWI